MKRERLKDQIEWHPPPSPFASFFNALVLLMAVVAVYFAVGDNALFKKQSPRTATVATPAAKIGGPGGTLILTVTAADTCYWNQQGPFALTTIESQLAELAPHQPSTRVVIAAQPNASFDTVGKLLELARHHDLPNVSLQAQP